MFSIPGSLFFASSAMMSSAPEKSAGDARYVFQDPFIQSTLSHTISTPIMISISSAFLLRRTQQLTMFFFKVPISHINVVIQPNPTEIDRVIQIFAADRTRQKLTV